jgi:hypothetical protein
MLRLSYHPNAFLSLKRNIKPGLLARTQILCKLEIQASTTKKISRKTGLSYTVVLYHLHLLETEKILRHVGNKIYVWELTGLGQQKLLTNR